MRVTPIISEETAPNKLPLYFIATIFFILLESIPLFDNLMQIPFFRNGEWLISRDFHTNYKFIFYILPKVFIGSIAIIFITIFLLSFSQSLHKKLIPWRIPSLIVALSIALIPFIVSEMKAGTGVYSPIDLIPYGGNHPQIGWVKSVLANGGINGGRSFPAGHASGGFALISLYILPVRQSTKNKLLALGILVGWSMGLYQMARGEHFLSHTLVSMFLALTVTSFLVRLLQYSKITSRINHHIIHTQH